MFEDPKTPTPESKQPIAFQIENRNFLAPTGFHFQITRAPLISFFGRKVNVPSMTMDSAVFRNYLRNIPLPGTRIEFQDLEVEFMVDEDLSNYLEISNWIRGLGFPESLTEIYKFQKDPDPIRNPVPQEPRSQLDLYSDGTLTILDSNNIANFRVKFEDLFPTSLSTLQFDATQTELEYFRAVATFKYKIYNIEKIDSCC